MNGWPWYVVTTVYDEYSQPFSSLSRTSSSTENWIITSDGFIAAPEWVEPPPWAEPPPREDEDAPDNKGLVSGGRKPAGL